MYVAEESDSGIVPMNHSNKIEQSMAESEEGRPLIKENIHQSSTRPTQSGTRVSQGLAGVRKASFLIACRQSSEIRAVCANERSYGSVRGAISNDRPYRDLTEEQLVRICRLVGNSAVSRLQLYALREGRFGPWTTLPQASLELADGNVWDLLSSVPRIEGRCPVGRIDSWIAALGFRSHSPCALRVLISELENRKISENI